MQFRSAIRTGRVLDPQKSPWINRAILKPKLTCAAVVWWKVTERTESKKTLDHIQAVTLRGIFELRRSTLSSAIRMIPGRTGAGP